MALSEISRETNRTHNVTNPTQPDSTTAECDPYGEKPCFSNGQCLPEHHCPCQDCVDYRIVRQIRESGKNCTIAEVGKFLKYVCFNETKKQIFYRCRYSDVYYQAGMISGHLDNVDSICEHDLHGYQACGFNTQITNSDVLCGGYFCPSETFGTKKHLFVTCTKKKNCRPEVRNCHPPPDDPRLTICDGQCDKHDCEDESICDGSKYGVHCNTRWGRGYVPVSGICDSIRDCRDESDEHCSIPDWYRKESKCTHFKVKVWLNKSLTVPIHPYTRCVGIDVSNGQLPYCLNYMDQTNCSDINRVGGFCTIKGYSSTISKYVVCKNIDLCDNNLHNTICVSPNSSSTSECTVHKHRMCDHVIDCSDGSDETHNMCMMMTAETYFKCQRLFKRYDRSSSGIGIPVSWILDGVVDCMNGEDENTTRWTRCKGNVNQIVLSASECENVFICPGNNDVYIKYEELCDEVESCGVNHVVLMVRRIRFVG